MAGYLGNIPTPQATQTRDTFTATASQTSFATSGYTVGMLDVYLNGIKLASADFTASNGSDVVLASGASADDIVEVVSYSTFETNSGVFTGDFSVDSPTFKVDSSNNRVGIGTASPSRQAMISRSIADGSGELGIVSSDSSTTGALGNIHFGNSTDTSLASIRATADGATDAGKLEFNTEKTGGSIETAMKIDSNGYVTTPLRPYFHATGSGTQSWSGTSAYQTVQFNTVWENLGSHYDTSSYTFTVPVAGAYFFWYSFTNQTDSSTGPEAYIVYTPSGGSASYRASAISYAPYYTTVSNNAVINCAKDSTVLVKLLNNNNTSFTIGVNRSTFGGYLIG